MSDEGFMKSALERALERADKIEISQDKLDELKYRAEGERLAAEFLKNSSFPLADELAKLGPEAGKHVLKAVESVFLQNLALPRKEIDNARNDNIFRGLSSIKTNKSGLRQVKDQLANLSNYYSQAIKQNYEQLKSEVERAMSQAIQQKTGAPPRTKLNVERAPEFQENWRQLSGRLDTEYGKALAQLKQQIAALK